MISCGHDYTMVLTLSGELMIAGKMPFDIGDRETITQFEQLAKFETAVRVIQIESSQFTTILAQLPGEEK
jgi:hypothetical protein